MLREARQAQGLHIAALAASIKVSQRKVEMLESDRLSELPDATFARALAQTICRSLKIDPAPVLAALPQATGYRLEAVDGGINAPFRDRPGRHDPSDMSSWVSPAVWAPALIAVAALAVFLMPTQWVSNVKDLIAGEPASTTVESVPTTAVAPDAFPVNPPVADAPLPATAFAASAAASEPTGVASMTETVHAAPDSVAVLETAASAAVVPGPLQLKAAQQTWIEVVDGRSQVLMSRMLQPGEAVVLDGAMPLKLKVGNAAGTEVAFRGQVVDLAAVTRDNVARFELK